jgi:FtsP/CotA-like multicopper oxidase with cupredoxin domain
LAILQARAKTMKMMPLTTLPPVLMSSRWLGYVVTGDFDKGDVDDYAFFLIAGRPPQSPAVVIPKPGKRVRLRIINSGADATFAFFVEGATMTVTHADSVPVKPIQTGALVLGPGERWDATVVAGDGVRRMIGAPLGRRGWPWR